MNSSSTTPFVSKLVNRTNPPVTPDTLLWDGFWAYTEGQQLDEMPTHQQRRGWWYALDAYAAAEMPQRSRPLTDSEIDAELEDLREGMADDEFNRYGGLY